VQFARISHAYEKSLRSPVDTRLAEPSCAAVMKFSRKIDSSTQLASFLRRYSSSSTNLQIFYFFLKLLGLTKGNPECKLGDLFWYPQGGGLPSFLQKRVYYCGVMVSVFGFRALLWDYNL